MSTDRVHPGVRAGQSPSADPFDFAGELERVKNSRRTYGDELEAVLGEEAGLGRPVSPRERDAFVRGFHSRSYSAEVRLLTRAGLLDDEE